MLGIRFQSGDISIGDIAIYVGTVWMVPVAFLVIFLAARLFTQLLIYLRASWTLRHIPRYGEIFGAWKFCWNKIDWRYHCDKMRHKDGSFPPLLNCGPTVDGRHWIAVSHPSIIRFVLSHPESNDDQPNVFSTLRVASPTFADSMTVWLGEGLLSSSGPKWHIHRKSCIPLFFYSVLQEIIPFTSHYAYDLVRTLRRLHFSSHVARPTTYLPSVIPHCVMRCLLHLLAGENVVRECSVANAKTPIDWILQQHDILASSFTKSLKKTSFLGGRVWHMITGRLSILMPWIGREGTLMELETGRRNLARFVQFLINGLRQDELETPGPFHNDDLLSLLFHTQLDEDDTIRAKFGVPSTDTNGPLRDPSLSNSSDSIDASLQGIETPSPPMPSRKKLKKHNHLQSNLSISQVILIRTPVTSPSISQHISSQSASIPNLAHHHSHNKAELAESNSSIISNVSDSLSDSSNTISQVDNSTSHHDENHPHHTTDSSGLPQTKLEFLPEPPSPDFETLKFPSPRQIDSYSEIDILTKQFNHSDADEVQDGEDESNLDPDVGSPSLLDGNPTSFSNSPESQCSNSSGSGWETSDDEEEEEEYNFSPMDNTFPVGANEVKTQHQSETLPIEQNGKLDFLKDAACEPGLKPPRPGHLPDETIIDQFITFLNAGFRPLISSIYWCIYYLAKEKSWRDKIRNEIHMVLDGRIPETHTEFDQQTPTNDQPIPDKTGNGPQTSESRSFLNRKSQSGLGLGDVPFTKASLSKLTLTTYFIKEVLRLHPPIPVVERIVEKDILLDNVFLPEGTALGLMMWNLHHDPTLWDDPEVFNPDRWQSNSNVLKNSSTNYLPFSSGAHSCIGQKFGFQTIAIIVSLITRAFDVELPENANPLQEIFFDEILNPSVLDYHFIPRDLINPPTHPTLSFLDFSKHNSHQPIHSPPNASQLASKLLKRKSSKPIQLDSKTVHLDSPGLSRKSCKVVK